MNKKGSALITSLLFFILVSVVGTVIVMMSAINAKTAARITETDQAFYIAKSVVDIICDEFENTSSTAMGLSEDFLALNKNEQIVDNTSFKVGDTVLPVTVEYTYVEGDVPVGVQSIKITAKATLGESTRSISRIVDITRTAGSSENPVGAVARSIMLSGTGGVPTDYININEAKFYVDNLFFHGISFSSENTNTIIDATGDVNIIATSNINLEGKVNVPNGNVLLCSDNSINLYNMRTQKDGVTQKIGGDFFCFANGTIMAYSNMYIETAKDIVIGANGYVNIQGRMASGNDTKIFSTSNLLFQNGANTAEKNISIATLGGTLHPSIPITSNNGSVILAAGIYKEDSNSAVTTANNIFIYGGDQIQLRATKKADVHQYFTREFNIEQNFQSKSGGQNFRLSAYAQTLAGSEWNIPTWGNSYSLHFGNYDKNSISITRRLPADHATKVDTKWEHSAFNYAPYIVSKPVINIPKVSLIASGVPEPTNTVGSGQIMGDYTITASTKILGSMNSNSNITIEASSGVLDVVFPQQAGTFFTNGNNSITVKGEGIVNLWVTSYSNDFNLPIVRASDKVAINVIAPYGNITYKKRVQYQVNTIVPYGTLNVQDASSVYGMVWANKIDCQRSTIYARPMNANDEANWWGDKVGCVITVDGVGGVVDGGTSGGVAETFFSVGNYSK